VNAYTYDEIRIGQEESFQIAITDEDMAAFRKITGDDNPIHCDDAYAKQRGYEGRVVYGMLTASYLSALAGMYLPGEHSLIHETAVKFVAPNTKIGRMITVCGKVAEKHDIFKRLTITVTVADDSGAKLLRGTMKVGMAR
jgi:acyl dehydratase